MGLTGIWMNELNSVMALQEHADRSVTGKYKSIVGRDQNLRELAGRTGYLDGQKQMLGFSVCFEIARPGPGSGQTSICSWSGWWKQNPVGKEVIETHWLLTTNELDPNDEWASHLIGEDEFEKVLDAPTEEVPNQRTGPRFRRLPGGR